ncbi:SBBP repeat-containing protein [Oscillatoria sp. FACHB-1407]|uniref:SBBP repeat-containing protein n=1 Tax=Oscillatoria sp. FACHB-1407 TaxID=2692847 RepID=UPI001683CE32|nr:SBBP repeat-containing protein [Oscillatoria sp. FACHB-1407]MBD2461813.1 SBBP repeat-containing protein [Oscillatoria sp. FACHB-1407]
MATTSQMNNSLRSARNIGNLTNSRRIQRSLLSPSDSQDYFRFNVSSQSNLTLSLTNLRANADVFLLDSRGRLIKASTKGGTRSELIQTILNADTYFVRILRRSGTTRYTLQLNSAVLAPSPNPNPTPSPSPTQNPTPSPSPSPTSASQRTQEWIRQIPTDNPAAATAAFNYSGGLAIDSFGNTFVSGYSNSPIAGGNQAGFDDAWFAKYDNTGNQQWIRRIATNTNDYIRGLSTDPAGNIYLAGLTLHSSSTGSAGFIAKYDTNGNQLWIDNSLRSNTLGDIPEVSDIAIDRSGNLYITGVTAGSLGGTNPRNFTFDAWVAKYDSNGSRLWIRQLGTAESESSTSIAVDSLGNAYIGGTTSGVLGTSNAGGSGDAWFAKYDTNGSLQWVRQFGTSGIGNEAVSGITVDSSDNVYLTGDTAGAPGQLWAENKPWLVKYNANGDRLWSTQFGTFLTDSSDIAVDGGNNIYTVGRTQNAFGSSSGGWNAYFAKFDSNGVNQWGEILSTSSEDRTSAIALDSSNNIYMSGITGGSLGRTNPREPVWDVWVAKYRQ